MCSKKSRADTFVGFCTEAPAAAGDVREKGDTGNSQSNGLGVLAPASPSSDVKLLFDFQRVQCRCLSSAAVPRR